MTIAKDSLLARKSQQRSLHICALLILGRLSRDNHKIIALLKLPLIQPVSLLNDAFNPASHDAISDFLADCDTEPVHIPAVLQTI